ncbi:uncharacterized protein LOC119367716 [Triticum dicoccoides]|uniref:uncharacterized protein LOC119367716 n=1 Tax=Triticum dicoccoides TaxID=85692 RepID=UPI00188F34EB|nr:uncharacterized protein LOC119367716 [Triticum dicoccoides]
MRKDTITPVANLQFFSAFGLILHRRAHYSSFLCSSFPSTHTRGGRRWHFGLDLGSSGLARQLPLQIVGRRRLLRCSSADRRVPGLPLRLLGPGRRLPLQLGRPAVPGAPAAARRTSGFHGSRCSSSARGGGSRCSSAARRGDSRCSSANRRVPGSSCSSADGALVAVAGLLQV